MIRIKAAIGLISAALIAYQLALIQILSIAHWHHFAYMVISVAMLGFGASGTLLSLFRKKFIENSAFLIPFLMLLTSIAMSSAVYLVEKAVGGFDTFLLFVDNGGIVKLFLVYIIYTAPFLFGALAIGHVIMRYAHDIGHIYFYNMAGSGVGGLAGVLAMWTLFPEQLTSVIALLPLAAAMICLPPQYLKNIALILIFAIAFIFAGFYYPPEINISQYKSLSTTMNLPGAEVISREKSPHGVITVVKTDASRYAPGVSLNFSGIIPVEPMIFINSNWVGPLKNMSEISDNLFLFTTKQLPYLIRPAEKILVASAGTGRHVLHGLANNAGKITAVEANPVLTAAAVRESEKFYGRSILTHPDVEVIHQSNRAYLNRSGGGYSHIIIPALDAFGGTSGLYALQEQYDLTLEAFSRMWNLLLDDGVISVTSWVDQPPRNTLRLLATLVETAEINGIKEADRHIAAIRSWATITFVLSRSPVSNRSTELIRKFCESNQFDPALLPGITDAERYKYNYMENSFFSYLDTILSDRREVFYDNYMFNIRPAADNRPFFSQFLKISNFNELNKHYGTQTIPFIELGYLVLILTGIQITVAGIIFIILPLFRSSPGLKGKRKGWTILYFGGIGTGFMFVEINLIQQFINFFGQPVYAAAVVLAILLVSSGIGSYFSTYVIRHRYALEGVLILLAFFIIIIKITLPAIINACISMPAALRLAVSILFIAPAGFLMGIPFPAGIDRLYISDSCQIPWAWGINGSFSVTCTVAAVWLALESGYGTVLMTGAIAYAAAGVATMIVSHKI